MELSNVKSLLLIFLKSLLHSSFLILKPPMSMLEYLWNQKSKTIKFKLDILGLEDKYKGDECKCCLCIWNSLDILQIKTFKKKDFWYQLGIIVLHTFIYVCWQWKVSPSKTKANFMMLVYEMWCCMGVRHVPWIQRIDKGYKETRQVCSVGCAILVCMNFWVQMDYAVNLTQLGEKKERQGKMTLLLAKTWQIS